MALQRSLDDLSFQLARLREALEALGTTVEEDRPKRSDVVVATDLAEAVLAVRGFAEEAYGTAVSLRVHLPRQRRHDLVARELTTAQESFHRFTTRYDADLNSHARRDDLASVARERGRDWADWTGVVIEELEQCHALAEQVRDAFLAAWQELVLSTMSGLSIQNTSIGQQIVSPEVTPARELNPN